MATPANISRIREKINTGQMLTITENNAYQRHLREQSPGVTQERQEQLRREQLGLSQQPTALRSTIVIDDEGQERASLIERGYLGTETKTGEPVRRVTQVDVRRISPTGTVRRDSIRGIPEFVEQERKAIMRQEFPKTITPDARMKRATDASRRMSEIDMQLRTGPINIEQHRKLYDERRRLAEVARTGQPQKDVKQAEPFRLVQPDARSPQSLLIPVRRVKTKQDKRWESIGPASPDTILPGGFRERQARGETVGQYAPWYTPTGYIQRSRRVAGALFSPSSIRVDRSVLPVSEGVAGGIEYFAQRPFSTALIGTSIGGVAVGAGRVGLRVAPKLAAPLIGKRAAFGGFGGVASTTVKTAGAPSTLANTIRTGTTRFGVGVVQSFGLLEGSVALGVVSAPSSQKKALGELKGTGLTERDITRSFLRGEEEALTKSIGTVNIPFTDTSIRTPWSLRSVGRDVAPWFVRDRPAGRKEVLEQLRAEGITGKEAKEIADYAERQSTFRLSGEQAGLLNIERLIGEGIGRTLVRGSFVGKVGGQITRKSAVARIGTATASAGFLEASTGEALQLYSREGQVGVKDLKDISRAGGLGALSAGLFGTGLGLATTGRTRVGAKTISAVGNILDPREFPGDVLQTIAEAGTGKVRRRTQLEPTLIPTKTRGVFNVGVSPDMGALARASRRVSAMSFTATQTKSKSETRDQSVLRSWDTTDPRVRAYWGLSQTPSRTDSRSRSDTRTDDKTTDSRPKPKPDSPENTIIRNLENINKADTKVGTRSQTTTQTNIFNVATQAQTFTPQMRIMPPPFLALHGGYDVSGNARRAQSRFVNELSQAQNLISGFLSGASPRIADEYRKPRANPKKKGTKNKTKKGK